MKKISKRFKKLQSLIFQKSYSVDNAILLVKKLGTCKFVESVEAHISLNIDPKYINQQLRTNLVLPNGIGIERKIAVFTEEENVSEILAMGASIAGSQNLIEEISARKFNFDILITTPNGMKKLVKLGKFLGPKGLMPSPKLGTVTENLKETIQEFKKGKIEYKADKTGIVHINFGKILFSEKELKENLLSIYNSIEKNKPSGVKGRFFKSFTICTTMSPSINLELNSFKKII